MELKKRYVDYIKENFSPAIGLILEFIIEKGFVEELQSAVNEDGGDIAVDGIIGPETLNGILTHNNVKFWTIVMSKIDNAIKLAERSNETKLSHIAERRKQVIMNFLFHWEGRDIAWLPGERSVTAPLGVYCYAEPSSGPCKYLRELYEKYSLDYNSRTDAERLNNSISKEERQKLFELAWEHYRDNWLNDPIADIMEAYPKSSLSYFSNSINGGRSRGIKTVQEAIGVTVTGTINKETISKLKKYMTRNSDEVLNYGILKAMARFYCYLAYKSSRASHYKQFIHGWMNRIHYLGYDRTTC